MANSTQKSELSLLAERVSRLEKRLAILESNPLEPSNDDVIDLSEKCYRPFKNGDADLADPEPIISRLGRTPLVSRAQLERRRDDLVNFIEVRWPDLVSNMRNRKGLEHLLQTLKNVSPGAPRPLGPIST